jgi:hypothetical protein
MVPSLAQGRDDRELDIFAAVPAPVEELALPRLAGTQGAPHFLVGGLGCLAGVEQSRILADDLVTAEAGIPDEGLVDVLDAGVDVGDRNAFGTLLQSLGEFLQLLLGAYSRRNVDEQTDGGRAVTILDDIAVDLDFGAAAVAPQAGNLVVVVAGVPGGAQLQFFHHHRALFGCDEVHQADLAYDVLGRVIAGQRGEIPIHIDETIVLCHVDSGGRLLDQGVQARLAFLQCALCRLALRDVA